MRLTLRTMLAYMDEILEPKDAEEIGERIRESEFATNLLHRTHDVMRRLRLSAPEISDRKIGLDPNTVAEYLDNTLPDDRVPDFEKVCLESDVHLAEVAACHQILALVLGSPAEVDPRSRQRMYQLPQTLEQQTASMSGTHPGELASHHRERPEVPDYLREPAKPRRRWIKVAGFLGAIAVVILVVAAITGQFRRGAPVGDFLARNFAPLPAVEEPSEEPSASAPGQVVPEAPKETPSEEKKTPPPAEEASPPSMQPAQPTPPVAEPASPTPPVAESVTEPKADPAVPDEPGQTPVSASAPSTPEASEVLPPGKSSEAKTPALVQPETAKSPEAPASEPSTEAAPVPKELIGRLVSDGQVLLGHDMGSNVWKRIPPQGTLTAPLRLLALPTYRPIIALTAGVTLQLVDGTLVEIHPDKGDGFPLLKLVYGRIVMRTLGKPQTRLWVEMDGRRGVLTFGDAESTVAVEITRHATAGADPTKQPASASVDLYVISGHILWQQTPEAEPLAVEAPAQLQLKDQPPQVAGPIKDLPKWIVTDTTSLLDQRASGTLEPLLSVDRSLSLSLREAADHRQKEVRWLAARCLGHTGEFDLMVAALNDPEQKLIWPDYIEHLRGAILRSPDSASQIKQAFSKIHGEDAEGLFRLLWGYSEGQLRRGQAEQLVDYLDHEVLAFRVLSFWNLQQLTGLRLYYRPEVSEAKRRQSIQKWRERIQSERFTEKSPPDRPSTEARPEKTPAPSVLEDPPASSMLPPLPSP